MNVPKSINDVVTVSKYSFVDIFQSKIMTNVFLLGIGIVVLSLISAEFTYGVPERIALDVGIGFTSLSLIGISIFMGAGLLSKDIESRTVYMVLSRPISRTAFLTGKIFGMLGILWVDILVLGSFSLGVFVFLGGKLSSIIYWCFVFMFVESLIILMVVVLFSLITNNVMSVIYSLLIYVLGHSIVEAKLIHFVKTRPYIESILDAYSYIFPNLNRLNIKDFVLYERSLPSDFILGNLIYGILYFLAMGVMANIIFNKKDLD